MEAEDLARYAKDPAALIGEVLYLPDGQRFGDAMAPFQRATFDAVFDPDAPPNTWISRPRGGSKTTDTAAIAIADLLLAPDDAKLFAVAGDLDQAALLRDAVERWVQGSPELHGSLRIDRTKVTNVSTRASLAILASDAPTALGLTPWRVYADELASWVSSGMWSSLVSAMHKQPGARMCVLTTAGSPSSWAYDVWEHAQASDMWAVLHTDQLAPWIDTKQVEDAKGTLPASMVERYFANRWVQGDEALFTTAEVDACFDWNRGPSTHGDGSGEYLVGVDYGAVSDRSAIATLRVGRKDGIHRLERMWVRQGSREHRVSVAEVESELERTMNRFGASTALVDPYQMAGTIERVRGAVEFPFTVPNRVRISNVLLQVIREGRVRLLPDPELRQELLSLIVKETSYGWRSDHPPGGHDDRAMALALALLEAEGRLARPVAWTMVDSF